MESELFGHEKGAFTGAHARKPGKFEMADGSTLLLDEIGELPLSLQAKLLRVLQESEYERVGGTGTMRVDVRIICATAKNLAEEAGNGTFRQDLFYRLNVIPLIMPPLRDRIEDIPDLVHHFLHQFSLERVLALQIQPEAMQILIEYDYPGNIREMKNIIERATVLARQGEITPADLPADLVPGAKKVSGIELSDLSSAVARTEKELIVKTLSHCGGKRTNAAELLGISRKNLWEKMKQYAVKM